MTPSFLRQHAATIATAILIAAFAASGPIAQPAHYHDFADARALAGIANAADVLSNLGFLVVGLLGWRLPGRRAPAYAMFCLALVGTAFGSGWYHLAPTGPCWICC